MTVSQTITILKTDGGDHPPDLWAITTAETIFDINPDSPAMKADGARLLLARQTQMKIIEVLTDRHEHIQKSEHQMMDAPAKGRLVQAHTDLLDESAAQAEEYMTEIDAILVGTPWEGFYGKDNEMAGIARECAITCIVAHLNTIKHNARNWHSQSGA